VAQATAQTNVNCVFWTVNGVYTCRVGNQIIADNENLNFTIGGTHTGSNTDAGVRAVEIEASSNIPFVIPELFQRFPNVFRFIVNPSGLNRIQSNAFRFARNLELIIITANSLHTVQSNAFVGADNLRTLDLRNNQIMNIFDESFNGLSNLRDFMLENNRIRRLPQNVLRPLTNVESVYLSDNLIETVDGSFFTNNRQIREIDLVRNRINEIGRNVLDGLNNLQVFNIFRNRCANNIWVIGGTTTIDSIRTGLSSCFVNYDSLKRLRVEIRGKATISDDYGNEILSM
jgi:Leucine-rich repeat (LRR) protein